MNTPALSHPPKRNSTGADRSDPINVTPLDGAVQLIESAAAIVCAALASAIIVTAIALVWL